MVRYSKGDRDKDKQRQRAAEKLAFHTQEGQHQQETEVLEVGEAHKGDTAMNKVGARTMHVALGLACVLMISVTPTLAGTEAAVHKQQMDPRKHNVGGFFGYNIEMNDDKEQVHTFMPLPLEFLKEERRNENTEGDESQKKKKEEVFVQMNVVEAKPSTDVFQQFTDNMNALVTDLMAPFEEEDEDATTEDDTADEDEDGFFAGNVFGNWFSVPWFARPEFSEPRPFPHPHPHPHPFPHPDGPGGPMPPPPSPKVCDECLEEVTEKLIGQATKKLECMCAGVAKKCNSDDAAKTDYCRDKVAWCTKFKSNPKFGIHYLRDHFDFTPRMEALAFCSKTHKCPPPPPPPPHHHHRDGPGPPHHWGPPHHHHLYNHDDDEDISEDGNDAPLGPFFNTMLGAPRKAAPARETPAHDDERRPIRDAVRKTGDFFRRLFG